MDLITLRRTAAEIAALAVYELFPDVELLGGGATQLGFYYDFVFPHELHLHLIEEKMRQIVRERRPIKTLEMIAFSASELLKKEGHMARVEEVGEGMVELIQIGPFYDLCEGPHLKNTAELAAFKIEAEKLQDGTLRITGHCHESKEGLKQFLKKLQSHEPWEKRAEQLGFIQNGVWLEDGLKAKRHLIELLKKSFNAVEVQAQVDNRLQILRNLGPKVVAELLPNGTLEILFLNQSREDVKSCLHLIGKTLTILGFDHCIGSEEDYAVEDELGRRFSLFHVKKVSKKGSSAVDLIIVAEVEEIFPLAAEHIGKL